MFQFHGDMENFWVIRFMISWKKKTNIFIVAKNRIHFIRD